MKSGIIHSIETFGALDGPGIRYVLFLKGCPLRCVYCHNPDTWTTANGTKKTSDEVVSDVLRYRGFYKNGGFTVSGGEPMLQKEFVTEVFQKLKAEGIHTALDTAGSLPLEETRELIDTADMLLLDIKAGTDDLYRTITGSSWENPRATLEYCEKTSKRLWIRHVVIPGLTDSEENIRNIGKLLQNKKCVEKIDLLPFHKLGEYKWKSLCLEYTLYDTPEEPLEKLEEYVGILGGYGLDARYNH